MRLRSYLVALAVTVLVPVIVVFGLVVTRFRETPRPAVSGFSVGGTGPAAMMSGGAVPVASGLVVIGAFLAAFVGGRITRPIRGLVAAAEASGRGDVVPWVPSKITEVNELGRTIEQAAIDRRRAHDELDLRARLHAALAGLGHDALMAEDLDRLINEAVAAGAKTLGVEYGAVFERLPGDDALLLRAGIGWREGAVGHATISAGDGSHVGRSLRYDEPVVLDAPSETSFAGDALLREHDVVNGVSVVIKDARDAFGALGVYSARPRRFSRHELDFLADVATLVALAFARAHLVKDLNARLAEMSGLLTVSQAISSTLGVTETMRRVARETGRMFGADMVGAYLADATEEVLVPVAGYHVPKHLLEPFREFTVPLKGHPIIETAWEEQRSVWSEDLESDARIHREAWNRFPHRSGLFVPMVATERPIGGLFIIWWHQRRVFLPSEIRLAEGVARQAAIAVANSRSYDDAQRRRREAEEVADIARLLTQSLDAATVARTMVNHVFGLFNADSAVLRLLRADGGLTEIARVGCEHLGFASNATLPPGAGLTGRAVREERPVWTSDILKEPDLPHEERFREALVATGLHAFVAVPLRTKHRIIGALAIAFASVRTFSDAEVTLLQTFADQAALALENARLYQDEERRRREAELLSELAQSINASLDLDTTFEHITEGARELCAGDMAMIGVVTPGADGLVIRHQVGSSIPLSAHPGIMPGHGLGGRVLATGRPARSGGDDQGVRLDDPDGEAFRAEGAVAVLAVPIKIADRVEGVLYVASRSPRPFDDDDETILLRLAAHAAVAIKNVSQFAGEQEARGGLRRLSRRLMEVQEEERRRIALELHDEIGQSLTALKLNLQLAKVSTGEPETTPRLHDSLQLADRVLEQVRSLSLDLRPLLLDDLGLGAALRWYVSQQAERAGIVARLATEIGEERLPGPIETTCFRVVQEAVTNILRHAHAREVRVNVRALSDRVELSVEDDGTGFDVAAARRGVHGGRSLGLLSMEERVSLIAGELSIDSAPGRGTRIHVTCPLTAATSGAEEIRP